MSLGNPVVTTTYKDTNSFHDFVTRGAVTGASLCNCIKAPNPMLSVLRRHEEAVTDTLYGHVPAVFDGSTSVANVTTAFMTCTVYPAKVQKLRSVESEILHALDFKLCRIPVCTFVNFFSDKLSSENSRSTNALRCAATKPTTASPQ